MIWVLQAEYGYEYDLSWVGPLNGQELLSAADQVFNQYWQGHFATGSSCDFGGAAELHDIPRNMSLGNYSYLFNGTDDAAGYFAQEGGPAGAHGSSGGGEEDGEASGGMGGAASDAPLLVLCFLAATGAVVAILRGKSSLLSSVGGFKLRGGAGHGEARDDGNGSVQMMHVLPYSSSSTSSSSTSSGYPPASVAVPQTTSEVLSAHISGLKGALRRDGYERVL
jgi:hypothetical protein